MTAPELLVLFAGMSFLVLGGFGLLWIVRTGREAIRVVEQRLPEEYERLGRPWPDYTQGERAMRYSRFILRRGYASLGEPYTSLLDEQRRRELGLLAFLVIGFALLGVAALWLQILPA